MSSSFLLSACFCGDCAAQLAGGLSTHLDHLFSSCSLLAPGAEQECLCSPLSPHLNVLLTHPIPTNKIGNSVLWVYLALKY